MSSQETRVCRRCGETKLLKDYKPHRHVCRRCHIARDRELKFTKPFKHMEHGCIQRAKFKSHDCTVTAEYLEQLWNAQQGLCYWSKVPMTLELGARLPNQVSVDRLDNSKGYTPDNIVLVTLAMNLGRSESPVETWLEYLNSLGILGLFSFVKSA